MKNIILSIVIFSFISQIGIHYFVNYILNKKPEEKAIDLNEDQMTYYFAYGSNMSKGYLSNIRKIFPKHSFPIELKNFQVTFGLEGPFFTEPAFAILIEAQGEFAYGVVHQISNEDFKRVVSSEVADYQIKTIPFIHDNKKIQLKTLVANSQVENKTPSKRYLRFLIKGGEFYQINTQYIEKLKKLDGVHYPIISNTFGNMITFVVYIRNLF